MAPVYDEWREGLMMRGLGNLMVLLAVAILAVAAAESQASQTTPAGGNKVQAAPTAPSQN